MKSLRIAAAAAILFTAASHAATTIGTVLSAPNATVSSSSGGFTVSGACTLTNIGSGTFSATFSFSSLTSSTATAPYTITLSGGAGTITGVVSFPVALLTGGSGIASATVTGGTGTYAGATGNFPNLTGTGSVNVSTGSGTVSLNGSGTIVTGGPPAAPVPTITQVLDAGSYTPGIAQGSVFVVKGTALSPSG